jgi:hypothetical protein
MDCTPGTTIAEDRFGGGRAGNPVYRFMICGVNEQDWFVFLAALTEDQNGDTLIGAIYPTGKFDDEVQAAVLNHL